MKEIIKQIKSQKNKLKVNCSGTLTKHHLVCKQTLNHLDLAKLAK